jgi:hypothetical protein
MVLLSCASTKLEKPTMPIAAANSEIDLFFNDIFVPLEMN